MTSKTSWGMALFKVHLSTGETLEVAVQGRDRWALEALISAGTKGCTSIDMPGPRWSGYIFNLRQLGIPIETVTEPHTGPFAGTHARYILSAPVRRFGEVAA